MIRTEREELLRRYLQKELSLEEEHEFLVQVALDKELRHELKAQQEIDLAFEADRGLPTSAEYIALQAGVFTLLPSLQATHGVPTESLGSILSTAGKHSLRRVLTIGAGLAGILTALLIFFFDSGEKKSGSEPGRITTDRSEERTLSPESARSLERNEALPTTTGKESIGFASSSQTDLPRIDSAFLYDTTRVLTSPADTVGNPSARKTDDDPFGANARPPADTGNDGLNIDAPVLWKGGPREP